MRFKINNNIWNITEIDKEWLINKYNEEHENKTTFVFGLCEYVTHTIFINKDMCFEQKIKTLKHELTHCYIWEYGMYNVVEFNEEFICDLVSASNDFISEVINKFKKNKDK